MGATVVTGSSTGIGYATALRLAADGRDVVATMRNPATCDIADVASGKGLRVEVRQMDVDDDDSVEQVFKDIFASHGSVDVLVNNAGIGEGSVVEDTDMASYRSVLETNLFGALKCMKAVIPAMREAGSGCIVNVSSQAGRIASPGMSAYCASKAALEAASESLAIELAPFNVRVAVIEPGMILTPIWSKVDMAMPTGPYAPVRLRLGSFVMQEMAKGSTADEVADCIAEAITTDEPKLRWLVGRGAVRNIRNRSQHTDEEWAAIWHASDEEFNTLLED